MRNRKSHVPTTCIPQNLRAFGTEEGKKVFSILAAKRVSRRRLVWLGRKKGAYSQHFAINLPSCGNVRKREEMFRGFFLRESQSSSTPNMGPSSPPLAPKATRHILTLYVRVSALSLSQQYRKSPIFAVKVIVLGNKLICVNISYFPQFDKPFSAFPILFPPAKKGGKSKRETV